MKKLSLSYLLLMMGLAMFLATSCDPDPGPGTGGTGDLAPTVALLDGTDITSFDVTVAPGAEFTVRLDATAGTLDLTSLKILEDGFTLDASRIVSITGVDIPNNPQVIVAADAAGFTWDITLVAHADEAAVLYEFEVSDGTLASAASLTVTTENASDPIAVTIGGGDTYQAVAGSLTTLALDIPAGAGQLATIGVRENGNLITDLNRLFYKDITSDNQFTANPQDFWDEDKDGFVGNIYVRAAAGTNEITIEVTNDGGESASGTVTFIADPIVTGTPISATLSGILLNAAGPAGTGGLDLDGGVGTGSNDALAEIKDEGIDQSLPNSSNWKQLISATNNAELALVVTDNLPEGFTFDGVTTIEEITSAFDNGTGLVTSGTVVVGDMYAVRRNGVDYLLRVDEVNATTDNNDDNYVFSIKY